MKLNLPVIQRRVLDSSILTELERCPRKAMYKYVYIRRSNEEDTVSMDFGTAYHTFRHEFTQSYDFDKALEAANKGFIEPEEGHKKTFLDKLRLEQSCKAGMSREVLQKTAKSHIIISSETSFELPLPSGRLYGGRFDRIVQWNDRLWVVDFKTKSWMLTEGASEQYTYDKQMSGYIWAAEQLSGRKIDGCIIEVMYNTKKSGPEIKPLLTTRTQWDIDQFLEWAEDKWDEWERRMKSMVWPQHATSCFDFFKKCEFFNACGQGSNYDTEQWLRDKAREKDWDYSKAE